MTAVTRDFVQGESAPFTLTLYDGAGDSREAIDGSGLTVALELRDRAGALVPTGGSTTWGSQADGLVSCDVGLITLRAANSPYSARWKVTDSSSNDKYYPNGEAERWIVRQ